MIIPLTAVFLANIAFSHSNEGFRIKRQGWLQQQLAQGGGSIFSDPPIDSDSESNSKGVMVGHHRQFKVLGSGFQRDVNVNAGKAGASVSAGKSVPVLGRSVYSDGRNYQLDMDSGQWSNGRTIGVLGWPDLVQINPVEANFGGLIRGLKYQNQRNIFSQEGPDSIISPDTPHATTTAGSGDLPPSAPLQCVTDCDCDCTKNKTDRENKNNRNTLHGVVCVSQCNCNCDDDIVQDPGIRKRANIRKENASKDGTINKGNNNDNLKNGPSNSKSAKIREPKDSNSKTRSSKKNQNSTKATVSPKISRKIIKMRAKARAKAGRKSRRRTLCKGDAASRRLFFCPPCPNC